MGMFGQNQHEKELTQATWKGSLGSVNRLIEEKVNPNKKGSGGLAPLHVAAYLSGGRNKIINNLLYGGAKIDMPESNYGWTALHIAVARGLDGTAEHLVEKGANVSAKDKKGATPLDVAEAGKDEDLIELLKAEGAVNGSGRSALGDLAVQDSKIGDAMESIAQAAR